MPFPSDVLALILAGGRGARLYPLTLQRAEPAVPIAGKYRLIDIPISNCINSGIGQIQVLTQFNSVSLHRHLAETFQFDAFHPGQVQVLAAEQSADSEAWFRGTADAVRRQLPRIRASGAEHVLILAGDHFYQMDYAAMVAFHAARGADITLATQPVRAADATRFGLLKRRAGGAITAFQEKPRDPAAQARMVCRDDPHKPYLGSMGIYLFRTGVLADLLTGHPEFDDFGSQLIPWSIDRLKVFGFDFDGYWQDIGTIRSFYETNLELTRNPQAFNFHDAARPVFSHARFLPGSILEDSRLTEVILAEGCVIRRAEIRHSIIGLRSQIGPGSLILDTLVMGADRYPDPREAVPIGIAGGCRIEGAILDMNVRIGPEVQIRPFPRGTDLDRDGWAVRDGIVVIPKGALLPAGTRIGP